MARVGTTAMPRIVYKCCCWGVKKKKKNQRENISQIWTINGHTTSLFIFYFWLLLGGKRGQNNICFFFSITDFANDLFNCRNKKPRIDAHCQLTLWWCPVFPQLAFSPLPNCNPQFDSLLEFCFAQGQRSSKMTYLTWLWKYLITVTTTLRFLYLFW